MAKARFPTVVRQIHRRMLTLADPARAAGAQRFFKTAPGQYGAGDRFLGIRVPVLRRLAREYQDLSLREASALLKSRWHEERLLALFVLVRQYGRADAASRSAIYRMYLKNTARINNWDLVDCSAEHIVGAQLRDGGRAVLRRLARSRIAWRGGARSIPSRLQAMAPASSAARHGPIRLCWPTAAMHGCTANAGRRWTRNGTRKRGRRYRRRWRAKAAKRPQARSPAEAGERQSLLKGRCYR